MSETPAAAQHPPTTFAHLLTSHRHYARLTQEELAAASGISARAISDMERGRVRGPQHRTVQALADALRLEQPDRWEFLRTAKAGRARAGGRREEPTSDHAAPPVPPTASPSAPAAVRPVPGWGLRELPPDVADLTGREREVRRMVDLVRGRSRNDRRAATVFALFGAPGVGKTTLAVHVAHRLAPLHPDGCLFLDLHGMGANRLAPGHALGQLLLALGVAPDSVPAGTAERGGLYRSLLRDKKVLLLLDNAADEAQVRPLLPSSPGSLLLVTSRRVLSGLESVNRMLLDVLSPDAAVALLASIVGAGRVAAERDAVLQVTRLCGYLPLALRIAGNRLASRPRWNIATLVGQLGDQRHRLGALTAGDLQVRSAFDVSYHQYDDITRCVFRRLCLVPGDDVTVDLAAVLAEVDNDTAERCLESLVDTSLLDTTAVGRRYVLNDLVRAFAGERLSTEESAGRIRRAEARLSAWVLDTAIHAGRLLSHTGDAAAPTDAPVDGTVTTANEAVRWLDTERSHWMATLRRAVREGQHSDVLAFGHAIRWYADLRPTGDLWREVFTYGVEAARALGRRRDEATQLNHLGWTLNRIHRLHREALANHHLALTAARESGDRRAEAWALQYCGRAELDRGGAEKAASLFTQAIAQFDEIGSALGRHITLSHLGVALHRLGRLDEAAATQRRAVAFFRRSGTVSHRNLLGVTLLRLADTLAAAGDLVPAYAIYRESGAVAAGASAHLLEGNAWFGCGRCQQKMGHPENARKHLTIALGIFTDAGDRWLQARVLHRLVEVVEPSDPTEARRLRALAVEFCAQLNTAESRDLTALLCAAPPPVDIPAPPRRLGQAARLHAAGSDTIAAPSPTPPPRGPTPHTR